MSGLAGRRSQAAAANANKGSGKTATDGCARRWSNLRGCGCAGSRTAPCPCGSTPVLAQCEGGSGNHDRRLGSQAARRLVALRDGWRRSRRSKIEGGVRRAFHFSPSEVDGWRSPQKPEGPSGRRCEDWTRRKELLFPDAGIVVWDRRIPPDTRLAGSSPCLITGVHQDQHFALDLAALIRGFRTPAPCGMVVRGPGPAFESLPRRKARGGRGLCGGARAMGI